MANRWVPVKDINYAFIQNQLRLSTKTNQFTNNGPNVRLLEERIGRILKIDSSKSVICVSNGTVALWGAVAAFELEKNRELLFATQAFTFPASAQGYLKNAVICDISSDVGIDLDSVPNTCDGIIVTNVFGNAVDVEKYERWANDNKKILIFDNAATPYTFLNNRNICNYGNASTISFHHTKPIGFGEGGCIIIDKKYESYLRRIINFGFDVSQQIPQWHRYGSNYKMSDIQAVFILQYLNNFDTIVNKHRELYNYFIENKPEHIDMLPNTSSDSFLSCLCILVNHSHIVYEKLKQSDIFVRKYYTPLLSLEKSNVLYERIICLPLHIDMSTSDLDKVIKILTNE